MNMKTQNYRYLLCCLLYTSKRGEILCSDRNDGKGWKKVMDKVGAMVAGGVMLLILCVLPAGMTVSYTHLDVYKRQR